NNNGDEVAITPETISKPTASTVIMAVGRRPSITEREESKAACERTVGPKAESARGIEPRVPTRVKKVAVKRTNREPLICPSRKFPTLFAPIVEFVTVLPGQLCRKRRPLVQGHLCSTFSTGLLSVNKPASFVPQQLIHACQH